MILERRGDKPMKKIDILADAVHRRIEAALEIRSALNGSDVDVCDSSEVSLNMQLSSGIFTLAEEAGEGVCARKHGDGHVCLYFLYRSTEFFQLLRIA